MISEPPLLSWEVEQMHYSWIGPHRCDRVDCLNPCSLYCTCLYMCAHKICHYLLAILGEATISVNSLWQTELLEIKIEWRK